MKSIHMNHFPLWGSVAISLTVWGALLSRGVVAQERPLFISGAGIPKAFEAGKPNDTVIQMRKCYEILKANDWDVKGVPFDLLKTPDQAFAEQSEKRRRNVTAFCVPRDPFYHEIALYTDLYFRENIRQYGHRTASHPEGFWLVMFRDGRMVKVKGDDVRLYPHPTIPEAMIPVFPGMAAYRESLPKLACYDVADS